MKLEFRELRLILNNPKYRLSRAQRSMLLRGHYSVIGTYEKGYTITFR